MRPIKWFYPSKTSTAFTILLGLLLLVESIFSLQWRMVHDLPLMMYSAFMIDHFHAIPYVTLFDMNAPGSLLAYFAIGKVVGYQDIALHLVDLATLAIIIGFTIRIQIGFGWKIAVNGAALFGLYYLGAGAEMTLQREYIALLPLAAVIFVITGNFRVQTKAFWLGFLFALLLTMRPPMIIGILPCAIYVLIEHLPRPFRWHWLIEIGLCGVLGSAIPLGTVGVYLWAIGAWSGFMDMVLRYWPLYTSLGNYVETVASTERLAYNLHMVLYPFGNFMRYYWMLVPALIGCALGLASKQLNMHHRRQIWLLFSLLGGYFLYPWLSGKFWPYHYLPLAFFAALLAAFCLVEWRGAILGYIALVVSLNSINVIPKEMEYQAFGVPLPAPKDGFPDAIAKYLSANVQPQDRVQALDITSGVIHGMLIAEVESATPFVYDFHFYHDRENPYIQSLREKFIIDLEMTKPRFIIESISPTTYPAGIGVKRTAQFEALANIINSEYQIAVLKADQYIIYERRP